MLFLYIVYVNHEKNTPFTPQIVSSINVVAKQFLFIRDTIPTTATDNHVKTVMHNAHGRIDRINVKLGNTVKNHFD